MQPGVLPHRHCALTRRGLAPSETGDRQDGDRDSARRRTLISLVGRAARALTLTRSSGAAATLAAGWRRANPALHRHLLRCRRPHLPGGGCAGNTTWAAASCMRCAALWASWPVRYCCSWATAHAHGPGADHGDGRAHGLRAGCDRDRQAVRRAQLGAAIVGLRYASGLPWLWAMTGWPPPSPRMRLWDGAPSSPGWPAWCWR